MKRATIQPENNGYVPDISIHALMKRATYLAHHWVQGRNISIHALMKRATDNVSVIEFADYYFNPRPHEEGDLCGYIL